MKRLWILVMFVLVLAACERTAPVEPTARPTTTGTAALSLADLTNQTLTAKADFASMDTATLTTTATVTATDVESAAIETPPSATLTATETQTEATATQASSPSPTATSTNTLTAQEEAVQLMAEINFERFFEVQQGTPVTMSNWAHPEAGCNWMSVAGQIFNLNDDPEIGYIIEAGGKLEGEPVLGLALTGLNSVYGPGGYEIQLADHTIASQDQVWVQLKDDAGKPLSYPIYLQTYDNCQKNLILLNFVEIADVPPALETFHVYLPFIQGP